MLREAGFAFERFDPPYHDPADPNDAAGRGDAPRQGVALAMCLARRKAESVPAAALPEGGVLLAADTLGLDPAGRLMGTPQAPEQALLMIRRLVGATHAIVSAAVLRGPARGDGAVEPPLVTLTDTALVTFGHVADEALHRYIASGDWRGKAGGYNLADRLAAGWPIVVEGDPATVMGLPMSKLVPALESLDIPRDSL